MNAKSESDLRQLVHECLTKAENTDDAWQLFCDEANARYSAEIDGPQEYYHAEAVKLFEEEKLAAFAAVPLPLVEEVAENMAIYDGATDVERFIPRAQHLLYIFEAIEGRSPADYLEVEEWSRHHLDKGGRFLVLGSSSAPTK
jgi:hypothetical protein